MLWSHLLILISKGDSYGYRLHSFTSFSRAITRCYMWQIWAFKRYKWDICSHILLCHETWHRPLKQVFQMPVILQLQKPEWHLKNYQLEIWDLNKPEYFNIEECYSKHITTLSFLEGTCIPDLRTPINAKETITIVSLAWLGLSAN